MTSRQTPTPDLVALPTAIWWLGDGHGSTRPDDSGAGAPPTATPRPSRFLSRLSRRLVLTYTSHGDVVVDFHGEAHLRQATQRTGRAYVHVAEPAGIADLDQRATPTSLIVMGRPSPASGRAASSLDDLLLACRLIMTAEVATLALLGSADLDRHARLRYAQRLGAAATSAGLHAVGAVIAVHQPTGTDRFLYYAAADDAVAALAAADAAHPVMRIDLFATTADDNHNG